ncbi:hypothetical protein ACIRBX_25465 [Kitasatospora sp. NPDC096147]|uniref:hypothetical protein n=1 Tax=Kitasatospora sp. NPDC096147 TaxID=3364093 RepID=UPI003801E321
MSDGLRLYRARPGGRSFRPATRRLPLGASLALALGGAAGLVPALALLGEQRATWFALGAFAVGCAVLGANSRPSAAPLIAGAAWLFFNGFVIHRHAVLGWSSTGGECARLGLFCSVALIAALPAVWPRRTVRTLPVVLPEPLPPS